MKKQVSVELPEEIYQRILSLADERYRTLEQEVLYRLILMIKIDDQYIQEGIPLFNFFEKLCSHIQYDTFDGEDNFLPNYKRIVVSLIAKYS